MASRHEALPSWSDAGRAALGAAGGLLAVTACAGAAAGVVLAARFAHLLIDVRTTRPPPVWRWIYLVAAHVWVYRSIVAPLLALAAATLIGRVLLEAWRGGAVMVGILCFSAVAAAGAHLSPVETHELAPFLSGSAAAALGGAALLRPRGRLLRSRP